MEILGSVLLLRLCWYFCCGRQLTWFNSNCKFHLTCGWSNSNLSCVFWLYLQLALCLPHRYASGVSRDLSSVHTHNLSHALLWFLLIWDFTVFSVTVVAADPALKLLKSFLKGVDFSCTLATPGFCVKCFQIKASETKNLPLHGSFFQVLSFRICLSLFILHSLQVFGFSILFRVDYCYVKES